MEALTVKQFYETFKDTDSLEPEETSIELNWICSDNFEYQSTAVLTNEQIGLPCNPEVSSYPKTSKLFESNHTIADKVDRLRTFSSNYNASSLPACQPANRNQIFANQHIGPINQNFTENKTLKQVNDRLGDIFKSLDNNNNNDNTTHFLPAWHSSTSNQPSVYQNVRTSPQYFSNTCHNGLGNISYQLENNNPLPHCPLSDRSQTFSQQYYNPGCTSDKENHCSQLENVFNNNEKPNLLQPSQLSNSSNVANHNFPLGNISINIGNAISLLSRQQSPKGQVYANRQIISEPDYMETKQNLLNNQSFANSGGNMRHGNQLINDSYNIGNLNYLPKTYFNQFAHNPGHIETINSMSTDKVSEKSQESELGFSSTINFPPNRHLPIKSFTNINDHLRKTLTQSSSTQFYPGYRENNHSMSTYQSFKENPVSTSFQPITKMNGYWEKPLTKPAININNINVHVHHPGEYLPLCGQNIQNRNSPLIDQRVPSVKYHPTLENNHNIFSVTPVPTTDSHTQDGYYFSSSTSVGSEPTWPGYNNCGPSTSTIKDDIYLPTCEESFQDSDIDDWLNSLLVTPLEPSSELPQEAQLTTKLKEKVCNNDADTSLTKKGTRRIRSIFPKETIAKFMSWFEKVQYPTQGDLEWMSQETGYPAFNIKVWFQNRRQALKRLRLESQSKVKTAAAKGKSEQKLENQLPHLAPDYSTIYSPPGPSDTLHIRDNRDVDLNYSVTVDLPLMASLCSLKPQQN